MNTLLLAIDVPKKENRRLTIEVLSCILLQPTNSVLLRPEIYVLRKKSKPILLLLNSVLRKKKLVILRSSNCILLRVLLCVLLVSTTQRPTTQHVLRKTKLIQPKIDVPNNNKCTAYLNNNDVVHDVVKCDHTNSIVVFGQVPRNITSNNNHIYQDVPNDNNKLMLITKIFNVNDVDVDVDTHCDRNYDYDDDQDIDSDTACDNNQHTTYHNSFRATKYPSNILPTATNDFFCSIIRDTDRALVNSGVVFVLQLLFYNLQRFDHYDNGHTYDVIYDIRVFNNNNTPCSGHLYNNNGTNNDTPDCLSGVENDRSDTIRYGNNNISFTNIYDVIVMLIIYNSVALVTDLDTISSSSGRSYVCLSSELAPVSSFSSDIFLLSSDCCLDCVEHIPIVLVAIEETISSLSSHSLSSVLKGLCSFSPSLYSCPSSSCTKSPSCIPKMLPPLPTKYMN